MTYRIKTLKKQICDRTVEAPEARPAAPHWSWGRLLQRVCALDMARCLPPLCGRREPGDLPFCPRGARRIIAAIPQGEGISKLLRHRKLAAAPPIAPARARQARCAGVASWVGDGASARPCGGPCTPLAHAVVRGLGGDGRAAAVCPMRGRHRGAFASPFASVPPLLSYAACPGRVLSRDAFLCAAPARCRCVLGPQRSGE
jgi:hypothetical protein